MKRRLIDLQISIARNAALSEERSVRRVEQDPQKPWAGVYYPREVLRPHVPLGEGLHIKTRDGRLLPVVPNSSGVFGYSGLFGQHVHITYTTHGGWRANGKPLDTHRYVGHELDCYRLYTEVTQLPRASARRPR